jgi:hypothetical protein
MVNPENNAQMSPLLPHLAALASSESGFLVEPQRLFERASTVVQHIKEVILSAQDSSSDLCSADPNQR